MAKFHDCSTISGVPFPFPYSQTSLVLLIVHWVITPVMMCSWTNDEILAGVFTFVSVLIYWALYSISVELENPFGDDPNDLDAVELQQDANSQLRDLLGEVRDHTPALRPGLHHKHLVTLAHHNSAPLPHVWAELGMGRTTVAHLDRVKRFTVPDEEGAEDDEDEDGDCEKGGEGGDVERMNSKPVLRELHTVGFHDQAPPSSWLSFPQLTSVPMLSALHVQREPSFGSSSCPVRELSGPLILPAAADADIAPPSSRHGSRSSSRAKEVERRHESSASTSERTHGADRSLQGVHGSIGLAAQEAAAATPRGPRGPKISRAMEEEKAPLVYRAV